MATNFTITPELLDQLLTNYEKPEDLTGDDGLFMQLKKALIERALGAELTEHLGYEKGDPAGRGSGNSRNGASSKTILTEDGEIAIAIPRDRVGSFEPQLIAKGQTRFDGFDDKILSLYARGMTVREIQGDLAELYGTDVSPDLISRVTDGVLDEVRDWQNRPLDPVYPVVFFDAENGDMALVRLEEFEAEWGKRYPAIGATWRRAWQHAVPFFAFAPAIRKMIYTTNAVEALHRSLRKIIKTRGSFPNDEAALKLLYLAIKNAGMRWRRGIEWTAAMGQFAIQFGDRFPGTGR
jgi:transposase-like protein